MSKKMPLVLIEWIDAHSARGWQPIEQLKEECCESLHVRTVGWQIAKKNGYTLLTSGISGENDGVVVNGNGHFSIPNVDIKKVTVLRKNG